MAYDDQDQRNEKEAQLAQMADLMNQQHGGLSTKVFEEPMQPEESGMLVDLVPITIASDANTTAAEMATTTTAEVAIATATTTTVPSTTATASTTPSNVTAAPTTNSSSKVPKSRQTIADNAIDTNKQNSSELSKLKSDKQNEKADRDLPDIEQLGGKLEQPTRADGALETSALEDDQLVSSSLQERELTAEMLRDPNQQESDKLTHLRRQQHSSVQSPQASSTLAPEAPAKEVRSSPVPSLRASTRRARPIAIEAPSSPSSYRYTTTSRTGSYQSRPRQSSTSSLKPKHVPPPPFVTSGREVEPRPQTTTSAQLAPQKTDWSQLPIIRPTLPTEAQLVMPIGSPVGLNLRPVVRPQASQPDPAHRASPFSSSLKSKSFGHILPRLAAKLFNGDAANPTDGTSQVDTLNQQQTFKQVTHFIPSQTQTQTQLPTRASRLFMNPRSRLVKNFFNRKPAASTNTPQQLSLPSPVDNGRQYVFMNGRLYSIVSATGSGPQIPLTEQSPSKSQTSPLTGSNTATTPIFDHQTSDTSEFPVFEAMSMQTNAMLSGLGQDGKANMVSSGSAPSGTSNSNLRCDRPRHVIQADRTVVNHILQSQQNFVIARVPIKKITRPIATTDSSPSVFQTFAAPLPATSQVSNYFSQLQMPSQPQFATLSLNPSASRLTAQSSSPFQTAPSIQFSASVARPSIWQSFVNLVSGMRRRPTSSSNSLLVDGPLLVAAGRRYQRRSESRPEAHHFFVNSIQSGYSDLPAEPSQYEPLLSSGTSAQSSQTEIDPMRRLLMLKTATDDEVCTPVGELESKIKYSCVPNHCVVIALANSTAIRGYTGQQDHKASNSVHQEQQLPPSRYQVSNQSKPLSTLQVNQYDENSYTSPPLVTYTHINAYQTPTISRLVQPQHQHIVSSSQQVLDALAQQDYGSSMSSFGPNQLEDFSDYSPKENLPNVGRFQTEQLSPIGHTKSAESSQNGPLIYLQLPIQGQLGSQGQPNTVYQTVLASNAKTPSAQYGRPTAQPTSVTFGTIRSSTMPMVSGAIKWTPSLSLTTIPPRPKQSASQRPKGKGSSQYVTEQPPSGELEPNEFVSAVDEQLERPIKVRTRRKHKRPDSLKSNSPNPDSFNYVGGTNNEIRLVRGDKPETNEMHSPPKRRREKVGHAASVDSDRLAGRLATDSRKLAKPLARPLSAPDQDGRLDDDITEEDADDEAAPEYDDQPDVGGYSQGAWSPDGTDTTRFHHQDQQQLANMSNPIAVPQRKSVANRKARRDQYGGVHTSTTGSPRYGLRQSTPLPAPEKSNNDDQHYFTHGDEMNEPNSSSTTQPGDGTTTDCDCAKTTPLPTSSSQFNESLAEGQPKARQSQQQQANIMLPMLRSSFKRNPTTLRPIKSMTHSQGLTNFDIAQDRRRQRGSMPMVESAKRYNLRNTTYKNLPLAVGVNGNNNGALKATFNTASVSLAAPMNDSSAQISLGEATSATNDKPVEKVPPPPSATLIESTPSSKSNEEGDDDDAEGDVTPHQYQIQVRWNNSTTIDESKKPSRGLELDQLREQVKDRLFEHREEEHWHERQRKQLAHKRRKLVDGKWQLEPVAPTASSDLMNQVDYGPKVDERETPIKDQLSDWPSAEERERHFAIPTRNFRQSAKFLDWVQRDFNLDEEPGEPKASNKSISLNL